MHKHIKKCTKIPYHKHKHSSVGLHVEDLHGYHDQSREKPPPGGVATIIKLQGADIYEYTQH